MVNLLATEALRARSEDMLRANLARMLIEGQREWLSDWRDLLMALAPFHDCARRLGLKPADVFAGAAAEGPPGLAETVRDFGGRRRVSPRSFEFFCEDTPDGPEYWHNHLVGVDLRKVPREKRAELIEAKKRELFEMFEEDVAGS